MRHIQFSVYDARRWLSLFLVCCIVICGIGGIYQRAQAVVVVDDAILAIVIAALAAMGITFTMTGGYQMVRDWIRDKITESEIDFTGVKYGASSVGSLLLNNVFVRRIAAFATYIKAELGLLDGTTTSIIYESGYVLADGTIFTVSGSNRTRFDFGVTYVLKNGNAFWVDESTGSQDTRRLYTLYRNDVEEHSVDSRMGINYRFGVGSSGKVGWDIMGSAGVLAASSLNVMASDFFGTQETNQLDAVSGVLSIPDDNTIGSQAGVLSLPVPWGQSMGTTLTDIPCLVLSDELAGNTTLELEDAAAVEDQVSDTATAEQPYVSSSASDYQSPGLSSVFPFCIPFDLYEFFECLAADPEAPEISWRFYVPGICDEQIEIDLSQFDTVAQIVRTMELLAFIVGLALVTREKFLRG